MTNTIVNPRVATPLRDMVLGFDHVRIHSGNAHQAARYFETNFGFTALEYAGLETGAPDTTSFLLGAGQARLIVNSPLGPGALADRVHRHGDTVGDIALRVECVDAAFQRAIRAGAEALVEPHFMESEGQARREATVSTPGDLVHTLVERDRGTQVRLRNGRTITGNSGSLATGIENFDHAALAVNSGELDLWVDYYRAVFGLEVTHEETTATEWTAMRSKVVENESGTVKFPIVEPAPGRKRSQVEDFLAYHDGPGVQHLAVTCSDICAAVQKLRGSGVEFLQVPNAYYEAVPGRLGEVGSALHDLRENQILIDRDEWGDLLQTFSKPVTGRPTLFFELIQRKGGKGFGGGNIRALFEAVERDQAARANW
jgi:4-hydroxyphenylpyruvate dioxygenase